MFKSSEIPRCQNKVPSLNVSSSRSKFSADPERCQVAKELRMFLAFCFYPPPENLFQRWFLFISLGFVHLAWWPQPDLYTHHMYWCGCANDKNAAMYSFHGAVMAKMHINPNNTYREFGDNLLPLGYLHYIWPMLVFPFIRLQSFLYPKQGCGESRAYIRIFRHELGIDPG